MSVDFALFLSPDGVGLAHRQASGAWALITEAKPEDGDFAPAMTTLHAEVQRRGGTDGEVLLILPDDQVLYTSFMAPTDQPEIVDGRVTSGLEGMTPYDVADLVYEWRAVEEDRVKVAVVAKETLDEASAFAAMFGFSAIGTVAMPPFERFPGMPAFGDTDRAALNLSEDGLSFGADEWVPEPELEPEPTPEPEPEATPEPEIVAEEPVEVAAVDAPEAADSLESVEEVTETVDAAPAETVDAAPAETVEDFPAPAVEEPAATAPEEAAVADAVEAERSTTEEDTAEPAVPEYTEAAATGDTSSEDLPSLFDEATDTDNAPDAEPEEPNLFAALVDPSLETPIAPLAEDDVPDLDDADAPAPEASEPSEPPAAKAKPAKGKSRSKKAAKSGDAVSKPRRPRFTPTPTPEDTSVDPEPARSAAAVPSFSARRDRSAPASGERAPLRADESRLGLGTASTPTDARPLHPDAAPAPSEPAKPGAKLAAQLARVRDASKAKPAEPTSTPLAAPKPSRLSMSAVKDGAKENTSDKAPTAKPSAALPADAQATPRAGVFARMRRGGATPTTAPKPAETPASDGSLAEATLTTGLLARKPSEPSGPSFRMGLMLTLGLLVLLAGVAIWSALFLPESPVGRWFGAESEVETAIDDPLDAPDASEDAGLTLPEEAVVETAPSVAPELEPPVAPEATVAGLDTAAPELADPLADATPAPEALDAIQDSIATAPDTLEPPQVLAPLPDLPANALPSLEETERLYAEDGIWPRTPDRPNTGPFDTLESLVVASTDPSAPGLTTALLPQAGVDPFELLSSIPSPPPFGSDGSEPPLELIEPTADGALSPRGAFIVAGRPPVVAIPRPIELAPEPVVETPVVETPVVDTSEAAVVEALETEPPIINIEDALLGTLRPVPRPINSNDLTDPSAADAPAVADATEDTVTGTTLAVAASRLPSARPSNIAELVAAAQRAATPEPTPAAAVATATPDIPTSADVARAATEANAIRLRNMNLIGVTGSPGDRRALIRMPRGNIVSVTVGAELDGGTVAAIGETSLQYIRDGRNITLDIPG